MAGCRFSRWQVCMVLTFMAATPSRRRSAVKPSVAEAMEAGFSQHLTKIRQIFSPHQSCTCADTNHEAVFSPSFFWYITRTNIFFTIVISYRIDVPLVNRVVFIYKIYIV